MVQPLGNNHYYPAPDARYGEASNNNPYDLEANLIDANSSVASQNNHTYHGVSASAFPILPNGPATALRQNSFEPPHNVKPSRHEAESTDLDPGAYWTANTFNSESAGSYAAFAPGPAGLPFDERLSAHPTPLHYYEASNGNAFAFAQESTDAASSTAASQYYDYTSGSVTAFPMLLHNPATVSHHDFESFYDSTHTYPDPPHDATTLLWLEESITPETQSTDLGSVTSYTSNYDSSPNSSVASLPSPVEIPFDNNVYTNASSSVAQLDHSTDRGVALPAPSPLPVPGTLVDSFSSSGATNIVPSFSDFETTIHEDEIFFRGTGLSWTHNSRDTTPTSTLSPDPVKT